MATTTMTTVDNILKEVYESRLRDQLQSEIKTLMRIERTSEGVSQDVGGKYTVFPIRVKRNHGIGARGEMEALPVARTQGYEAARVNLKYLYGSLELSGQVFELAERNPQAFASALDQEVNGLREGLKKDTNRQVYGTPKGVLATATTSGSTTTLVTDNAQYVEIGMVVDLYNDSDVLQDSGLEVSNVEETSPGVWTITYDTATSSLTGWYLTREGSKDKEKTGFEEIVIGPSGDGTGALFNITHPIWTSNVDSTSGALTEGRMISMVDLIHRRGGSVTVGFCSRGVRRAYFNLLVQQRRYTNTTEFAGGFSGLTFTTDDGDIPIVSEFDCQPGRLYFLNEKEIKLYQELDWTFMNRDGSNWQRKITSAGNFDAYQATLFKYCEIGTHRRNSHGVLTNVTEA